MSKRWVYVEIPDGDDCLYGEEPCGLEYDHCRCGHPEAPDGERDVLEERPRWCKDRYDGHEQFIVEKDGDQWCAKGPGFVGLQQSPAGFGATPLAALSDLLGVNAQLKRLVKAWERTLAAGPWKTPKIEEPEKEGTE